MRPNLARLAMMLAPWALPVSALAQSTAAPTKAPHIAAASPFDHPITLSLASFTTTVPKSAPKTHSRFSAAPLPDDDMDAPRGTVDPEAAQIRPDLFRREKHQMGDALGNNSGVNEQRRGHAQVAAGLSLSVPTD